MVKIERIEGTAVNTADAKPLKSVLREVMIAVMGAFIGFDRTSFTFNSPESSLTRPLSPVIRLLSNAK